MPSNTEVAELIKSGGKRLIGFSSVDPSTGKSALSDLKESHDSLGLKGLKLNPAMQAFDPSSPEALETYRRGRKTRDADLGSYRTYVFKSIFDQL